MRGERQYMNVTKCNSINGMLNEQKYDFNLGKKSLKIEVNQTKKHSVPNFDT